LIYNGFGGQDKSNKTTHSTNLDKLIYYTEDAGSLIQAVTNAVMCPCYI